MTAGEDPAPPLSTVAAEAAEAAANKPGWIDTEPYAEDPASRPPDANRTETSVAKPRSMLKPRSRRWSATGRQQPK